MNNTRSFLQEYLAEVRGSYSNDYKDNYDERRFGPLLTPPFRCRSVCKTRTKQTLLKVGLGKISSVTDHMEGAFMFIAPWLPRLEKLYGRLADEESKALLVKVIAFRALDHRKVKLPFNTPELWKGIERLESLASKTDQLTAPFLTTAAPLTLNRIDLTSEGVPVSLYSVPLAAYGLLIVQQYRCQCHPNAIEAAPGDHVLDGGGCWGDTALYFANKVGKNGRVFCFEFAPENLALLQKNLEINPALNGQIELVQSALWSKSGETLCYKEQGPGTKLVPGNAEAKSTTVQTLAIDDLITLQNLSKLDFIKMDIEGAELAALRGAEQTLKRFTPKLAICVYHRLEDFFDIPDYLASLNLGYRFYLRHFSLHAEETVLFASTH